MRFLTHHHTIQTVYLAVHWAGGDYRDSAPFLLGLKTAIGALEKAGKRAIVIGPIPAYDYEVPRRLAWNALAGLPPPLGQPTSEFLTRNRRILSTVWSAHSTTGMVHKVLCASADCLLQNGGQSLYSDTHHLSAAGADLVAKELEFDPQELSGTGVRR